MKTKNKITAIILGVMIALPLYATMANAAYCNEAVIHYAGVRPDIAVAGSVSKYRVKLSCVDTTRWSGIRYYYLSEDVGDSGYAAALTALSLGKAVSVQLESYLPNSLLTRLEVTNVTVP